MEGDSRNRLQGGGQGGVWVQEELTVSVLVRPGGYRCESHYRRSRRVQPSDECRPALYRAIAAAHAGV
jgi:hypothetical protein